MLDTRMGADGVATGASGPMRFFGSPNAPGTLKCNGRSADLEAPCI
jgi:hypothetical protein